MRSFLLAAGLTLILTAALLVAVLDPETMADPHQLRITVIFFLLVAVAIVAGFFAARRLARLEHAILSGIGTLDAAGSQARKLLVQVQEQVIQNEHIIRSTSLAWERYSAAVDDAERQRIRFLEAMARQRAADELSGGATPEADG